MIIFQTQIATLCIWKRFILIPFGLAGLDYLEYQVYQRYLILPECQAFQGVQEHLLTLADQRPPEALLVP